MKKMYTSEVNIQILISLLKKHNIKKVIVNPGTTHISFVHSISNDDFFEIYSCIDERSTAYMACGLAEESGEPVVITCTGATASRNYISGLTEAFYRKLPVIAITGSQHIGRIGQNFAQVIDRTNQLNDIVKCSVLVNSVYSDEDRWACNLNINRALLECKRKGGGPVHINLVSEYSNDFSTVQLPDERKIERIEYKDEIPPINHKKVAIFVGSHKRWDEKLTNCVDKFCEKYNAVVLCDHTSNYYGKYRVLANMVSDRIGSDINLIKNIDLLIHIGDVSGAYMVLNPTEVWRVNPDGEIRDTFKKLTFVFEMDEVSFFEKYNAISNKTSEMSYYHNWLREKEKFEDRVNKLELPFSNIWIAKNTINLLPDKSIVHFGILNSLRSWNYFDSKKKIYGYSNTGGFGIDGNTSSMIGASLYNPTKKIYGIIGDLAFFYDLNALCNKEIKNNLRLLVINNGCGGEFHLYRHRAARLGDVESEKLIAADGHNGNKSKNLVKNYVTNLGFKYITAETKEEFLEKIDDFINGNDEESIIFEVFTDANMESEALKLVDGDKTTLIDSGKKIIKDVLGDNNIKKLKKLMNK